ncbi:MAG TPA: hypothetical protein VHA53_01120 [Nitrolancea sp.]|jgi:hypothetical protein|nr:hypothetical protein [Nitrolancea sp.]
MLPFLLDDVARMRQDDMIREAEMHERAKQRPRMASTMSLPRRLRMRSGQFFITLGAYLSGSGSAAAGVQLDRAT